MLLSFFRKKSVAQPFSAFTALFILLFSFEPQNLLAFEGPKQPELSSFMQISADDMVDPFTGDFKYNIPLMNVPGPGGGYPINLTYTGGTMADESSWVGWGWNVNPGLINRQKRGVPDDFDGSQQVKKTYYEKDEHNILISAGLSPSEVLGADLGLLSARLGGNLNVIYNNKRGWSLKPGVNLQLMPVEAAKQGDQTIEENPEDKEKSNTAGDDQSANTPGQDDKADEVQVEPAVTAQTQKTTLQQQKAFSNYVWGEVGGASFSKIRPIASFMQYPRSSTSVAFQGKTGLTLFGTTVDFPFTAAYTKDKIAINNFNLKALGYMHANSPVSQDLNVLMDYSRDNEGLLNRSTKILPAPVQTQDLFQVSSHLMGGVFRAMRNDVAVYSPTSAYSTGKSASASIEWNTSGGENKFGGGYEGSVVGGYSGKWLHGTSALNPLREANTDEAVYFKFMGENNEHNSQYSNLAASYEAERPVLSTHFQSLNAITAAIGALSNSTPISYLTNLSKGISSTHALNKSISNPDRESKQATAVHYITEKEYKLLYSGQTYKGIDPSTLNAGDNTIAEFQILNKEGQQLNFGLPVFTNYQEDYVYATEGITYPNNGPADTEPYSATVPYSSGEAEVTDDNGKGREGSFSKTRTPKYAHAYLLTEQLSHNYRDIDNNGPSRNDLGHYTKFNWVKSHTETNRIGADGQNTAFPGVLSDKLDDRASFSIAEKEVYYVQSIETKTHKAVFEYTNDRKDALNFLKNGSLESSPATPKARLTSIKLYKLDDTGNLGVLIKEVHFNQSYNHWQGVTNSNSPGNLSGQTNARLTLDGLYTTYGTAGGVEIEGTNRNEYFFEYYASTYPSAASGQKPENSIDRWGNKQLVSENDYGVSNHIMPHTTQDKNTADLNAKEGLLHRINNPMGGSVEVDYEADDYGYVQDKKAMRLFEVVGVGASPAGATVGSGMVHIDQNDKYLLFKLEEPVNNTSVDVSAYLEGIDQLHFKILMGLKGPSLNSDVGPYFEQSGTVLDYIEGFARVDQAYGVAVSSITDGSGKHPYGIVKVKQEDIGSSGFHPFELAALHHLKYHRFDLRSALGINFTAGFNIRGAVSAVSDILNDVFATLAEERGYYTVGKTLSHGDDICFKSLPCTIRLNDPDGRKIGGGARVKSVIVHDAWDQMTLSAEGASSYEKYYFYDNEDGTSSGVATYEPAAGGEDNPLRMPVRSSIGDGFFFKDNAFLNYLPIGETYYPSPSVGYGRVTVYSNPQRDAVQYGNGIVEHTFYTAKDFPVRTSYTDLQRIGDDPVGNVMAFLGIKTFQFVGMAQGFSVVLNNMHGKPKHTATYSSNSKAGLSTPVSQQTYIYNTSSFNNKQIETAKTVIDNQYFQRDNVRLGEEMDVFMEQRESMTVNSGAGGAANAMVFGVFPIPSYFPRPNKSASGTKTATITKVFTQNATLDRVESMVDGSVSVTENLMYDPYTGEAVYTLQKTPFGQSTYTKLFPAYWEYPDMKPASLNWGKSFKGSEAAGFISPGDVLLNTGTGEKVWVQEPFLDKGILTPEYVADATGNTTTLQANDTYKIIHSGYRNQTSAIAQSLQSSKDVQDPTNRSENIYFAAWNVFVANNADPQSWDMIDCIDGSLGTDLAQNVEHYGPMSTYLDYLNSLPSPNLTLFIEGEIKNLNDFYRNDGISFGDPCPFHLFFPESFNGKVEDFYLYETGPNSALAVHKTNTNLTYECLLSDTYGMVYGMFSGCMYKPCVYGVLDASVSTFGNQVATNRGTANLPGNANDNPYKYNLENGFFYPNTGLNWLSTRIQSGTLAGFDTEAGTDGEYADFVSFDARDYNNNPGAGQRKWTETGLVTLRDLNGNALESKNPLGVHSAQLMDFCGVYKTAVAYNARFNELAFESFEDQDNCYDNNGNLDVSCTSCANDYYALDAHTGKYSFLLSDTRIPITGAGLSLQSGKKYVVRLWAKLGPGSTSAVPTISGATFSKIVNDINGWSLYEAVITGGASLIELDATDDLLIDDLLVKPQEGAVQTYVYDAATGFLLATLDDNHLGKIYTYDLAGTLTGVMIETEQGRQSVQSAHTSYSKLNNQ